MLGCITCGKKKKKGEFPVSFLKGKKKKIEEGKGGKGKRK